MTRQNRLEFRVEAYQILDCMQLLYSPLHRHLLQLKRDQTDTFAVKATEIASTGGWSRLASLPDGMTDAHMAFTRVNVQKLV